MSSDWPEDDDIPEANEPSAEYGKSKDREGDDHYDLEERTARFGEAIIAFAKKISPTPVNTTIISQLTDAGTSVGANYNEADDAESKKDFRHKIAICKKEARESKFWLRMSATTEPNLKDEARVLWFEAKALHLIFSRIRRSCDGHPRGPSEHAGPQV